MKIEACNPRKLLQVDNKLDIEKHISAPCKKLSMQLNAVSGLQKLFSKYEEVVFFQLQLLFLCWHFSSCKLPLKIEKPQLRFLELFTMIILETIKHY